jgi:hypothetical protein
MSIAIENPQIEEPERRLATLDRTSVDAVVQDGVLALVKRQNITFFRRPALRNFLAGRRRSTPCPTAHIPEATTKSSATTSMIIWMHRKAELDIGRWAHRFHAVLVWYIFAACEAPCTVAATGFDYLSEHERLVGSIIVATGTVTQFGFPNMADHHGLSRSSRYMMGSQCFESNEDLVDRI